MHEAEKRSKLIKAMEYFLVLIGELIILFLLSQKISQATFMLFYKITRSQKISLIFFAILFYPGVLVHELAHFIMARILVVPAGKMEFVPVMRNGGVKLGSVAIARTDPLRRMLIGVAPILVGTAVLCIAIYSMYTYNVLTSFWHKALFVYVLFVVGNTMFSSKKDLEGTLEFSIALIVVGAVAYFFGFRLPDNTFTIIFNPKTIIVIKQALLFMAIPIALDSVVLLTVKVLRLE